MINYGNRANMRRRRRRYNIKRICILVFILLAILIGSMVAIISFFSRAVKKDEVVETNKVKEVEEVKKKPWDNMSDDETISKLSGLPVSKDEAEKRPVAIVYDNSYEAFPQMGLKNAEIVYEVPAEGELVRLIGIFQDINLDKIGPVRSARSYMLDYAFDNDAIFVHYGNIDDTEESIKNLNSPSINGMSKFKEEVFKVDTKRNTEDASTNVHNQFTFGSGIMSAWLEKGYTKIRETANQVYLFKFGASDETKFDTICNNVKVKYSYYQLSEFRYDEKTTNYKRYQTVSYNEMQQVDGMGTDDTSDDKGLEYKNIIIQYVDMHDLLVDGVADKDGKQMIDTLSSGDAVYITNGTSTPITWEKKDHYEPTKYKDSSGNEIELNRGKTWICIVPKSIKAELSAEKGGSTSNSTSTTKSNKTSSSKQTTRSESTTRVSSNNIDMVPSKFKED